MTVGVIVVRGLIVVVEMVMVASVVGVSVVSTGTTLEVKVSVVVDSAVSLEEVGVERVTISVVVSVSTGSRLWVSVKMTDSVDVGDGVTT